MKEFTKDEYVEIISDLVNERQTEKPIEYEYIIHKHSKECRLQFVNCKRIVLTEEEYKQILCYIEIARLNSYMAEEQRNTNIQTIYKLKELI